MTTARIVVVEDDMSVAELVLLYLKNAGYIVEHAPTGARARQLFDDVKPALDGDAGRRARAERRQPPRRSRASRGEGRRSGGEPSREGVRAPRGLLPPA